MTTEERSPFTEHLGELRDRLIRSAIAVGIGFCIAYFFKEKLFEILTAPLIKAIGDNKNTQMIFTGLPEAFFTYMKVSLIAGIVVSTPVIFYEFWMFVSPGLYRKEKKYFLPIVLLSVFFFIVGASFGYFIAFPYGFKFFLEFSTDSIHAMLSMKEYLSFSSTLLLAFGFTFELPLVLAFMARMGLVTVPFLQKNRKYAILIIFIVAAILTPGPDIISQLMMAVPLMLLYEIGIIGARMFGKKPDSGMEEETDSEEDPVQEDKVEES